jgi:site-specific DNA-cytosine methylase
MTFLEFFCGGGLAPAGLGPGWMCSFANDNDPRKAAVYAANWIRDRLIIGDVPRWPPRTFRARDDAPIVHVKRG